MAFTGFEDDMVNLEGDSATALDHILAAPAAPSFFPSMVAEARGTTPQLPVVTTGPSSGKAPAVVPPTLGEVMAEMATPAGFSEVVAETGADADTFTTDFCMIPESDLLDALNTAQFEDEDLKPIQKAKILKTIRQLFAGCGFAVPALGSPATLAPPPVVPDPASTTALAITPSTPAKREAPSASSSSSDLVARWSCLRT